MAISTSARVITSLLLLSLLGLAQAQQPRTINVAGEGKVSAAPDLVTINTGVVTTAKTAEQALADNNSAFNRVLRVLKMQGIAERDVQTTFFNVRQQFARGKNGQRGELTGHVVTNEVQVKVRRVDTVGAVLDALVKAGSNRINNINFSIADPVPLEDRARAAAVMDAQRRAALFAKSAGLKLGKIISISENPITPPVQQFASLAARSGGGGNGGVGIAAGELDVTAKVFILYEIRG